MENNKNTYQTTSTVSTANETGAWDIQGHIKIFYPDTQEIIINKRA